jgi:hypothetical protein
MEGASPRSRGGLFCWKPTISPPAKVLLTSNKMKKLSNKAKGGIVLIIILGLTVFLLMHLVDSLSAAPSSAQHVLPGDQGMLETKGASSTTVGISKAAYDQFFKAVSANDAVGYYQLQQNGQIFSIDNGTKVLVIDSSWGYDQVRFLDGKYVGQTGWAEYEMVSNQ